MKRVKTILTIFIVLICTIFTTGCWNYKEVDEMAIVAGVAVDKSENDKYLVTAEILHISGGKDTKIESKTITASGETMFDAVRNEISLTGERLYWGHAKVLILSKEVAAEGVMKVIDWYIRDSETRNEVFILVSRGSSAREIFHGQKSTEEIKSFALEKMIKSQRNLSKAPIINVLQFDNDMEGEGISPIAPVVDLINDEGKMLPQIMGTAIFKKDKLVGFLNGEETKDLLFIRNEIKGGVLVEGTKGNDISTPVSLEIFKSKTKVVPVVDAQGIGISLNIKTSVAIDEIGGTENLIEDKGRLKLEQSAEKSLKGQIEALVEKIQSQYKSDIFGFGARLREDNIGAWKDVGSNWEKIFESLKVDVATKVHIENSATHSRPLKAGD
ncbi:MAG: Ger(x)C family spore germination protein [Pseudomonadota bacterium]